MCTVSNGKLINCSIAFTVSAKLVVDDRPPPSVTVSVMEATPLCPAVGVSDTDGASGVPPKTIFVVESSMGLFETAVNDNSFTEVRSSPMVNGNAEVVVP